MTVLSIVTAFFNEEENLPELRKRFEALADRLRPDYQCEFVLIDDHSRDGSQAFAEAWAKEDCRVRYLRLAKNGGSHAAYAAGLAHAQGDCAVLLAADLQDPPELVPTLLARWSEGNDVVWAVRAAREGISWLTRWTAGLYYRMMRRYALPNMPKTGADFLLLDRKVIQVLRTIPEKHTSLLGMVLWLGFRQTEVEYVKQARFAGESKWTFAKKLKLLTDSLVSFSALPMSLIMGMTTLLASGTLLGLLFCLVLCLLGSSVPGWVWIVLAITGVGAMQLTAMGLLGSYIWRMFDQVRGRPRYVIENHQEQEQPPQRISA